MKLLFLDINRQGIKLPFTTKRLSIPMMGIFALVTAFVYQHQTKTVLTTSDSKIRFDSSDSIIFHLMKSSDNVYFPDRNGCIWVDHPNYKKSLIHKLSQYDLDENQLEETLGKLDIGNFPDCKKDAVLFLTTGKLNDKKFHLPTLSTRSLLPLDKALNEIKDLGLPQTRILIELYPHIRGIHLLELQEIDKDNPIEVINKHLDDMRHMLTEQHYTPKEALSNIKQRDHKKEYREIRDKEKEDLIEVVKKLSSQQVQLLMH